MSLEGSLETVALPEVLQLLADTSKSGELRVSGDRGEGKLWFASGRLTGFEVGRCPSAPDAVFDLLRTDRGQFSFVADAEAPTEAGRVDDPQGESVRDLLAEAQARLEDWPGILSVLPSLDHTVGLSTEVSEEVNLDPEKWSLVVAIGEGRSVSAVLDRAGLGEFDCCRSVKDLVDAGLARIDEPVVPSEVEDASVWSSESPVSDAAAEADAVLEVAPVSEPAPALSTQWAGESPTAVAAILAHTFGETADPIAVPEIPEPEVHQEFRFDDLNDHDSPADEDLSPWTVHLNGSLDESGSFEGEFDPQPVPFPEAHLDDDSSASGDNRSALQALIAEIPADDEGGSRVVEDHGDGADGLADRGPWTSHELASLEHMGGWHDEPESVDGAVEHGTAAEFDADDHRDRSSGHEWNVDSERFDRDDAAADQAEADDVSDSDEEEGDSTPQPDPVNRGLLLKFLSSVRS